MTPSSTMQDFKHLRMWQRAHALAIAIHKETARFGAAGHANLRSQLIRSAQSISTNIVEGCGAMTNREFARFLEISIKSTNETEHHLLSARDLDLIPSANWRHYSAETIEIRKMVFAYRKRILETSRNVL